MYKTIATMTLCLIGMLLSATSSFAYKVFDVKTGNITESNKIPSPTREIEQIESMYKVTYSFDSPIPRSLWKST